MHLEVFSDVACPFCFVGKRAAEQALAAFPHAGEVEVRWRSFELAPGMPATVDGDVFDVLAARYGISRKQAVGAAQGVRELAAETGVDLDLERVRPASTHDAHRLLQLAGTRGLDDALAERLFRAYFEEGATISDHGTLRRLAAEAGLAADEVDAVLVGDAYEREVEADRRLAEGFGLRGVPTFVLDRRLALTGAQPPEVLLEGLQRAYDLAREQAAQQPPDAS